MILFEKIRWKNFLSTGNEYIEIDFQTDGESRFAKNSTTLIVGTNGAGKSTIPVSYTHLTLPTILLL